MADTRSLQKLAGIAGLLVTFFIIGNVITLFASVNNNTAVFSDAGLFLPLGASAAQVFHLSMVFDVLAYLLFAPVVVFCWLWWKPGNEGLVSLYTFCGLAYVLLGSLGGVIVDALLPRMALDYGAASPAQQEILGLLARYLYRAVAHGIWNPLEVLMVSVWFLGLGWFLRRQRRALGILALVIGCVGLLDPLGWVFQTDVVLNIGGLSTALIPIWTAWFGIDLLRNPQLIHSSDGALYAGQKAGVA